MTKTYCDHCGKEITEPKCGWFNIDLHYSVGFFRDHIRDIERRWTLCPNCSGSFLKWLED